MKAIFNYAKRNRKDSTDFLWKEIELLGKDTVVYIATAFFSNSDLIKSLISQGCEIRLIIRLSSGTNGEKLKEIIDNENVSIRYYTSDDFHPKIYIFGDRSAIIGSSNLTKKGVQTNQEANIEIDAEEPVFEDVENIFFEYWNFAEVLTKEVLNRFINIQDDILSAKTRFDRKLKEDIGEVTFPNIDRGKKKEKKDEVFRSDFKRKYQIFLNKYYLLEEIYKNNNIKKSQLPIRIEIDRFLSWIRDYKAIKETYLQMPVRQRNDLEVFIKDNKKEFIESQYEYITITENELYPKIKESFKNKENIDNLNEDELFESLMIVNAFKERRRFFLGGENAMKEAFFTENSIDKVKSVIKYLLYGKGDYIDRITNCIFNEEYYLRHFGKSSIKELYGLMNDENIPLCNERTFKSMQYLGFGNLS